jgi:plasmid stabilization system protein ParE
VARVAVTSPADADIAGMIDYLAESAGDFIAARYVRAFEAMFDRLAGHPESGALRPALGEHVRIGVVWPYIAIYEYVAAEDIVYVLRIVHGRRKIAAATLDRPR